MTKNYLEVFRSLTEEQACERTFVDAHPTALCLTKDTKRCVFGGEVFYDAPSIRQEDLDMLAEGLPLSAVRRGCGAYRIVDASGNVVGQLYMCLSTTGTRVYQTRMMYNVTDVGAQTRYSVIDSDRHAGHFSPWSKPLGSNIDEGVAVMSESEIDDLISQVVIGTPPGIDTDIYPDYEGDSPVIDIGDDDDDVIVDDEFDDLFDA